MATTYIRDRYGRVIGMLEEGAALPKGNQVLRSPNGILVGTYEANGNVTRDNHGRFMGQGNLLLTLLNNNIRESHIPTQPVKSAGRVVTKNVKKN